MRLPSLMLSEVRTLEKVSARETPPSAERWGGAEGGGGGVRGRGRAALLQRRQPRGVPHQHVRPEHGDAGGCHDAQTIAVVA